MRLPNGYGSVYKLSGNRRRPWIARVTVGWSPEGKQLYYTVGYFRTRADALEALAEYHQNPIGEARDTTLGQIYDRWYESKKDKISPSQMSAYTAMWKRLKVLEKEPVRHIRKSHLQEVIDNIEKEGLSRSSLEKAKTLAGMLFQIAVDDEIIKNNPARGIELPPARKPKRPTFTDMEIRKVEALAHEGDIWAGTIMMLLYTGMRIGELVALTRFSVDINEWLITGGIKTDAGRDRVVPVHPKIRPFVRYWHDTRGPRLVHRDGKPISTDYYRKHIFYPTLQRAGIERHITPHATRHTFATLLDRAKVNTKHIQELIGHSDYAITANIYTHPRIDELRKAIESI